MFDEFEQDQILQEYDSSGLAEPSKNVDIIGHADIEQQLLSLTKENTLPHTIIFSGNKGIGKSVMAFRLARYLLANPKKDDSMGGGLFGEALPEDNPVTNLSIDPQTPTFRQVAAGAHPDLLYLQRPYDEKKDKQKDILDIETARKTLPFMRMTPSNDGGYRVAIIDDADTMNRNAQNALLKILEEPPEHAVLILVTHRIGALIPTIRSRCRTINFKNPAKDDFATLLRMENASISDAEISQLHSLSGGSPGQALGFMEDETLSILHTLMAILMDGPDIDWLQIHSLADNLSRPGQEKKLRGFENITMWFVRHLLKAKACNDTALPEPLDDDSLLYLLNGKSLEEWIKICENLDEHFTMAEQGNLDKRYKVLGAFMILTGKEK